MKTTTTKREAMLERIRKHGQNLLAIFPNAKERDPVKLCKRLRALEARGNALGLRLCNGPAYPGENDADRISDAILAQVNALLGNSPPAVPVFINRDPRGCALKIDSEWMAENGWGIDASNRHTNGSGSVSVARLHRDWGGYGLIAPDLTEGD